MMIVGRNGHKDDSRFHKSYSVKEKRQLVQSVQLLMDEHNVSARQACLLIGVNQMYDTPFKRVIKKVDDVEHGYDFFRSRPMARHKSLIPEV